MAGGCCWSVGLEPAPCRWNCDSSAPACGGGTKKGTTTTSEAMTTAEHTDEALGRSKGGFSTKIHLRAEGGGKPVALLITAGQRHVQTVFKTLMETGAVKRVGKGKPRIRPERVVGDKGYSSRKIRRYLCKRGIGGVIARQKRERRRGRFDEASYRKRNVVERLVNRLKQFRRVATRYEKRAVNYLGMLTIAAIVLWLRD
jgi:transposase